VKCNLTFVGRSFTPGMSHLFVVIIGLALLSDSRLLSRITARMLVNIVKQL